MPGEARFFWGSCYPENMIPDWQEEIDFLLQKPYAYCIHNSDKAILSEDRKEHIHIIIVYGNNSTAKAACRILNKLSLPGKKCCPYVEPCDDIKYCYNYLIHDTDNARKKGKHLYAASDRHTGNGFDIGLYEQLSKEEKDKILKELEDFIIDNSIMNVLDLLCYIKDCIFTGNGFTKKHLEVFRQYQGYINNLCKGAFNKWDFQRRLNEKNTVSDHNSAP